MLSHFLASIRNGKETVGVRLSCQLVKIGTFTNQLPDDVNMLLRDSFTYRTVLDERTDDFTLSLLAPSAKRTKPYFESACSVCKAHQAMRVADMTDGLLLYISFPFEFVLVNNL